MRTTLACLALLLTNISSAHCATPPSLLNKSIQVSFSTSGTAKDQAGNNQQIQGGVRATIYVSSLGRVFVRGTAVGQRASREADFPIAPSAKIVGRRMMIPVRLIRGAASIVVNFDSQFENCSADVAVTSRPITFKDAIGRTLEMDSPPAFGSPTCSIRSGNALSN
jgi:hypothetical protein